MSGRTSGGTGIGYSARLDVSDVVKNSKIAVENIRKMREEAGKALKVNTASIDIKPLTAFQQANLALKKTLIDGQAESQRLRNETIALNNTYRQGAITAQELAAAERQSRKERRDLVEATRAARIAQVAANGSYDEANARLKELGRNIKAAENGFNSTNPVIKAQINEYNTLNDSLKRFDAQMGNHQRNVGNYKSAISGVIGDLRSLAIGYLSVQGALSAATKAFDVNRQSQAIEASLKFTLGSAEAATDKLNELRQNALRLGQDFLPIAESYAKFAGAARAANFPLEETDRIFKAISVAGARFNLTSDQVSGALLAIQQMISKGTVQSEELRGQLGERLPGAFAIAAKAMGVTEQKLGKLLQSGEVLASDLLPKLATQLEQDFGLKAGENIDNLNSSVGRLSTTVDTALKSDGFGKLAKGVVDATTNIVSAIDKLMGSRSVKEFFGRFFSFRTGDGPDDMIGGNQGNMYDKINAIQDKFKSSSATRQTYRKEINPIGSDSKFVVQVLAEKPLAELEQLRKKYLTAATEAANAVNIYKNGIAKGILSDGGEHSLEDVQKNFKAVQGILAQVNTAYFQVKEKTDQAAKSTKELTDAQLTSFTAIRKRIADLSKQDGSAIDGSAINKRIDALKARLKDTSTTQVDVELNARNTLQKKINDFHNEAVKRQESADEQELTSVRLKYATMREEAVKFNNDPKNKKRGLRVDGSVINADEKNEEADVKYRQDAKKQLESLDIQKKQYAEYEQFKNQFGAEMAEKRFGKEIIDNKTFLKKLNDEKSKLENIPVAERTGGQKDYLTEINKRIAAETDAERGKYDALLTQLQGYQDKVKAINDRYTSDKADIASNPLNLDPAQLADQYKKLEEDYKKEISRTTTDELTNSIDWTNLFSDLGNLAEGELDRLIKVIGSKQKELAAKFDPIDLATVQAKLQQAKDELISRNPFKAVGESIKAVFSDGADGAKKSATQIKTDWNNLGKSTKAAFDFVNDAVQSADFLKEALGDVGGTALASLTSIAAVSVAVSAAIKTAEKGSIVLAVISAALVVVQAVANVFKSIFNAGDKRIEKTIKGYQDQIKGLESAFKNLQRQTQNSVGETYYTDSIKQVENLKQQQTLIAQQRDAERDKKKTDESKVQAYQDQIDDINNQIEDIGKSVAQMLIQTNFREMSDNLADALVDAFTTGEDALSKFDQAFDAMIVNAVKNSLKLKILDPIVKKFTDDLTAYAEGHDNSVIGFDFESWKTKLEAGGKLVTDGLKKVENYFPDQQSASGSSALQGKITAMSETDALILEGLNFGTRLTNKIIL